MRIVKGLPPNFSEIVAVFPRARGEKVVFTFGDTIFAPGGGDIAIQIIAHEEIHSLRQGADPFGWWKRYLADPKFRFDEELIAHRVEWMTWSKSGPRNRHVKRGMMKEIAGRLAGPLYGNMVSFDRARELILAEAAT